jgi:transcription-repair coupling factor (superfamily II helicase)
MPLDSLTQHIADVLPPEIKPSAEPGQPVCLGLRRAARLPVLAALYRQAPRPLLLLTDRADHALTLLDELSLWLPEAARLLCPEPNPLFYEDAPWGETTRRDRLTVLTTLAAYHIPGAPSPSHPVIVAPVRAVMTRTLPRRDFLKATRPIKKGQAAAPDDLARQWVELGYEASSIVVLPGQFARRGGILDIWPPAEPQPVRLEFFGDEIDTLRRFDPATQRTVSPLDKMLITPAREYLAPPDAPHTEFYLPTFHSPASLLDYLPRQALILLDDRQALQDSATEIEEQAVALRRDLIADGSLPVDFPLPYLTWSEVDDALQGEAALDLGMVSGTQESPLAQRFTPGPRFGGRLKPVMDHLSELVTKGESVHIVSRQSARLQELWAEQAAAPHAARPPIFIEGSLTEGFTLALSDGRTLHLLTDGEIFGWRRPEPRRRARPAAEAPETFYADLQPGDWVVHVDHGIGRFGGLVQRAVDGVEREYLAVEYAEGDQLFVPVYQADRLTRYVGPESREPSASRLGGVEWKHTKENVKEAVQEIAQDLLDLYARRQIVQGYAFGSDVPWQQELEASFPYVETQDQLRVIGEVKRDMQTARPMDRLICGDVGYGKTEVALRAAFKAVMDGRQVAVLVPTTVLAQQHYNTFRERLAAFPAEVEMLSRFRTPQQQHDITTRLVHGKIDIVIGTHRLLSADVQFKDLGLLIIDEEQRFGVTHKETLKKLRTEVDVLTLTATPIPRTLYMALTGVRDISTINTPPEERLPIITHVGPFSTRLIRQAIVRELERGGQVFFVHNRVQTIDAMRRALQKIVPEARIGVGHGQMPEEQLSNVMIQFTEGESDVLLCTTIIESGLDIPNANTLIVDRADTFGLAQLYQLRGRVGRGAQRAYAYFFRHKKIPPTLEGRQRLEVIAENTQLGAGFSIAMRDLEIRGAGELLGMRQSGHIAAVGFHLYTRLLADAVRRMQQATGNASKGGLGDNLQLATFNVQLSLPVNVDLPLPVSLPPDYITDDQSRLRLYRRIADLRALPEIDALAEEFNDRFGPPPEPVKNLLQQLKIKLLAEKAGLASLSSEGGQIVLRYPPLPDGLSARDLSHIPDLSALGVRRGKNALWMVMGEDDTWLPRLWATLEKLVG